MRAPCCADLALVLALVAGVVPCPPAPARAQSTARIVVTPDTLDEHLAKGRW